MVRQKNALNSIKIKAKEILQNEYYVGYAYVLRKIYSDVNKAGYTLSVVDGSSDNITIHTCHTHIKTKVVLQSLD